MKIKILGPGCPKCRITLHQVERALKELNGHIEIEKIESLEAIMSYNMLSTPVLIINDEIKAKERVPSVDEIKQWLRETKVSI